MTPPQPAKIEGFNGLNLAAEEFDIGLTGAVDLLNVDFDWPGRIRTRDGYAQWNNTTLSATGYSGLVPSGAVSSNSLLAIRYASGGTVNIDQVTAAGTTTNLGSFAGAANTFSLSYANLGGVVGGVGGTPVTYIAFVTQPSTGVTLVGVNAATGVTTATGKPLYLGTTAVSSRLIEAGFFAAADSPTGANGNRSTAFFSDPGTPMSFGTSNWVQLRPGDGEVITGLATFGNETYIFKQSAAFAFYSESTDSTGNPVFNYRRIDLPEPLTDPVANAPFSRYVVAGEDGVYYSTSGGIWRLTPGSAAPFSSRVNKVFSRDPIVPSTLEVSSSATPPTLSFAAGRLFAAYTNGSSQQRQLVFDPKFGQWTVYDLPAQLFAEYPGGSAGTFRDSVYFVRGSGNNNVFVQRPTAGDDSGTAISWSWTSGIADLGTADRKRIRLTQVAGYGSATVQWTAEDARSTDPASASGVVTLGTRPTIATTEMRTAVRGRRFQLKLSGSGQAGISEVVPYLSAGIL